MTFATDLNEHNFRMAISFRTVYIERVKADEEAAMDYFHANDGKVNARIFLNYDSIYVDNEVYPTHSPTIVYES